MFYKVVLPGSKLSLFVIFILFISGDYANGQSIPLHQYRPTHEEIVSRYKAVVLKDSTAKNTVFKTHINAQWMPDGKAFWYSNVLRDSVIEYIYVIAASGKKQKLFAEDKLAEALGKSGDKSLRANHLWLTNLTVANTGIMTFDYHNKYYQYDTKRNTLKIIDSLPRREENNRQFDAQPERWWSFETDSISPNKQYVAYIKDNNVFIKSSAAGNAIQYTHDGSNAHPYGSLAWSPDSRCVIGYRITPVEDSSIYYVLSSVPGTMRGQLKSYPYKQPGDPFTTYEMYLFPVRQTQPVKVNTPVIDFFDAPLLHWTKDNSHFYYEKVDRGHQRFRIIEVNVQSGDARAVLDEQT